MGCRLHDPSSRLNIVFPVRVGTVCELEIFQFSGNSVGTSWCLEMHLLVILILILFVVETYSYQIHFNVDARLFMKFVHLWYIKLIRKKCLPMLVVCIVKHILGSIISPSLVPSFQPPPEHLDPIPPQVF